MARGVFGGDTSKSHFSVKLPSPSYELHYRERAAEIKVMRERNRQLKDAGFKQPYFQWTNGDEVGKQWAKAQAEVFAAEWKAKTGFEFEIYEGMFL